MMDSVDADSVRRLWWVLPVAVVTVVVGYVFYLSLALNLHPLWTGLGSVVFFCLGVAVFVGLPFFVGRERARGLRHRVYRLYGWLSRKALLRGLLVKRGHAGVDLCASRFDAEKGSEQVKLDGEWRDFEDVADRMHYLGGGVPFGIVLEGSTLMIDPVDSAIGRARKALLDAGEEVVEFGGEWGECVRRHVTVPEAPPVVDLADAIHLLGGSGEPTDAEATESFETKAWSEHQSVPVIDAFVLAGLFSAILFVIWLAFSFKESGNAGGGGGGFNIVSGMLVPVWGAMYP